jgi:hypothetical protein
VEVVAPGHQQRPPPPVPAAPTASRKRSNW